MSRFPIYHEMGLGMADPMAAANLAYAGARYRRREAVERPAVINARDVTREAAGIAGLAETEVVGAREEAEFRAAEAGRIAPPTTLLGRRQRRQLQVSRQQYAGLAQRVAETPWTAEQYGRLLGVARTDPQTGRVESGVVLHPGGRVSIAGGAIQPLERIQNRLRAQAARDPVAFLDRAATAGIEFEEPGPPVEARFEPRERWRFDAATATFVSDRGNVTIPENQQELLEHVRKVAEARRPPQRTFDAFQYYDARRGIVIGGTIDYETREFKTQTLTDLGQLPNYRVFETTEDGVTKRTALDMNDPEASPIPIKSLETAETLAQQWFVTDKGQLARVSAKANSASTYVYTKDQLKDVPKAVLKKFEKNILPLVRLGTITVGEGFDQEEHGTVMVVPRLPDGTPDPAGAKMYDLGRIGGERAAVEPAVPPAPAPFVPNVAEPEEFRYINNEGLAAQIRDLTRQVRAGDTKAKKQLEVALSVARGRGGSE